MMYNGVAISEALGGKISRCLSPDSGAYGPRQDKVWFRWFDNPIPDS